MLNGDQESPQVNADVVANYLAANNANSAKDLYLILCDESMWRIGGSCLVQIKRCISFKNKKTHMCA